MPFTTSTGYRSRSVAPSTLMDQGSCLVRARHRTRRARPDREGARGAASTADLRLRRTDANAHSYRRHRGRHCDRHGSPCWRERGLQHLSIGGTDRSGDSPDHLGRMRTRTRQVQTRTCSQLRGRRSTTLAVGREGKAVLELGGARGSARGYRRDGRVASRARARFSQRLIRGQPPQLVESPRPDPRLPQLMSIGAEPFVSIGDTSRILVVGALFSCRLFLFGCRIFLFGRRSLLLARRRVILPGCPIPYRDRSKKQTGESGKDAQKYRLQQGLASVARVADNPCVDFLAVLAGGRLYRARVGDELRSYGLGNSFCPARRIIGDFDVDERSFRRHIGDIDLVRELGRGQRQTEFVDNALTDHAARDERNVGLDPSCGNLFVLVSSRCRRSLD